MAELLCKWLQSEHGILTDAEQLDQDFSSGVLFAQLLDNYGLVRIQDLRLSSTSLQEQLHNYTQLQPHFQQLGISIGPRTANALINGQKGESSKLLYRLYSAVRAAARSHRETLQARSNTRIGTTDESWHLSQKLTQSVPRNKAAWLESLHLHKHDQQGQKLQASAQQAQEAERIAKRQAAAQYRQEERAAFGGRVAARKEALQKQKQGHLATLAIQAEREQHDVRVEKTLAVKRKQTLASRNQAAASVAAKGTANFEELHGENVPRPLEPRLTNADAQPASSLPGKDAFAIEAEAALKRVKAKVQLDRGSRKQSLMRGRIALAQQRQFQQDEMQKVKNDALLAVLARESQLEADLAAKAAQARRQAEEMKLAAAALAEANERDRKEAWEEKLQQEAELLSANLEGYKQRVQERMEAWEQKKLEHKEAKRAQHAEMLRPMVWQLVTLAERSLHYCQSLDAAAVPKSTWKDWAQAFVQGCLDDEEAAAAEAAAAEKSAAATQLVTTPADKAAALEYARCQGEWSSAAELGDQPSTNLTLGELLGELASKSRLAGPELDQLAGWPLKLAVIGKPYAGKSCAAQHMADKLQLKVLEPDAVILASIAEATAFAATGQAISADAPEMVQLGHQAKQVAEAGASLGDSALAKLIVAAIKALPGSPNLADLALIPAPGKTAAKASSKDAKPQGYVLDGFPQNEAQAAALEKLLTGLDLESDEAFRNAASVIAPPPPHWLPDDTRILNSGLEAVVSLDLPDNQMAVRRASGRRVDPQTGRIYHLEFDPPSAKDVGLNARLKDALAADAKAANVEGRLDVYGEHEEGLQRWMRRFGPLTRQVAASQSLPEVCKAAMAVAQECMAAQVAAAAATGCQSEAGKAREAAASAQLQAAAAQAAVLAAAKDLLVAKTAEVAAAALLEQGKDADPAAAALLKVQAAEKCAQHLKAANKALADAEKAAADAASQAAAAKTAAETASSQAEACEASKSALKVAAAAADAARVAAGAAEKAAARAQQSQSSAAALVAEATQKAAEVEANASSPAKGAKAPGQPKVPTLTTAAAVEDESDEEPAAPAAAAEAAGQPPHSDAQPAGTLSISISTQLHQFWRDAEQSYLTTITQVLAHLRCSREAATLWFSDNRHKFTSFMERDSPDKHRLVSAFQASFNSVDLDFRPEPETKAELALRCNEAQDALWDVCDERQRQNEQLANTIRDDPQPPARQEVDAGKFAELAQAELGRIRAARHVLLGAAQARNGLQIEVSAVLEVNVLQPDIPQPLQSKFDKKNMAAFPAWMPTAPPKQNQQLPMAFRLAWAWLTMVADEASGWQKLAKTAAAVPATGRKERQAGPSPAQLSLASAAPGLLDDIALARLRLQRIAERAQAHQAQLQEMADSTNAQVAAWQEQRFQGECSAVAALHQLASKAVMNATTLPFTLRLEGDQLVIDEEHPAVMPH